MKKGHIIFIILTLILTLSVGAVNAADLNQTGAVDADDVSPKSFYELNETIYGNTESDIVMCDLDSDYEFVEEIDGDFIRGIAVMGNTTINGNNHVINCKNKAISFNINESILYVNNLTLMNANPIAISEETGMCFLNNVRFIDDNETNSIENVFIVASDGPNSMGFNDTYTVLDIVNCSFHSTVSHYADIYTSAAIVNIKDSVFDSGEVTYKGHIVASYEAKLNVDNVTFNNLTGNYAAAIYANTYWLNVRNSRFANLYANMTAGAIGIKYSNSLVRNHSYVVENCIFENTNCANEGGAIFFDAGGMHGDGIDNNATMDIINSRFANCSSSFGGAIVQLSGFLNIVNSTFDSNLAFSCGGAVYTSVVGVDIADSNFTNNTALYQRGAIFHDGYDLNINGSIFMGNAVAFNISDSANAIYSYYSDFNVENSYFKWRIGHLCCIY
ncbi:hypothetical protein [uncultured Methanobrevibacter sp.]|uniref:hypothetical protein n=1 Tax=uncultured Methanobrevibacter sp. TaxID=253161 RepID=UPI002631F831|nr:hypothetical protein [uncultured Methanobrevibacter sp.]